MQKVTSIFRLREMNPQQNRNLVVPGGKDARKSRAHWSRHEEAHPVREKRTAFYTSVSYPEGIER